MDYERAIGEWADESLAELGIAPDNVEAQDAWLDWANAVAVGDTSVDFDEWCATRGVER